jgi:hypothetical protein
MGETVSENFSSKTEGATTKPTKSVKAMKAPQMANKGVSLRLILMQSIVALMDSIRILKGLTDF